MSFCSWQFCLSPQWCLSFAVSMSITLQLSDCHTMVRDVPWLCSWWAVWLLANHQVAIGIWPQATVGRQTWALSTLVRFVCQVVEWVSLTHILENTICSFLVFLWREVANQVCIPCSQFGHASNAHVIVWCPLRHSFVFRLFFFLRGRFCSIVCKTRLLHC